MTEERSNSYVGYEYKEVTVPANQVSICIDCYENFGWVEDDNYMRTDHIQHYVTLRMKRDRKLINKMELTRLQRNFEACAEEVRELEHSKKAAGAVMALVIGIVGTAFMAGSVFSITSTQPIYWLGILLAIPAFIGWIVPYYIYRFKVRTTTQKVQPIIESKIEEIYAICEKGHSLL